MKENSESFVHMIKIDEKEMFAGGVGVLDACGVEAGGRVETLEESKGGVAVIFCYYATRSGRGISLKFGEPAKFEKNVSLAVHRIQIDCLVLEESPDSLLILFPDPKKIGKKIRNKTKM